MPFLKWFFIAMNKYKITFIISYNNISTFQETKTGENRCTSLNEKNKIINFGCQCFTWLFSLSLVMGNAFFDWVSSVILHLILKLSNDKFSHSYLILPFSMFSLFIRLFLPILCLGVSKNKIKTFTYLYHFVSKSMFFRMKTWFCWE